MFPPGDQPGGEGGFDMGRLLQEAQRMQQEMLAAQQVLAASEVTGSAGGGLVRVTIRAAVRCADCTSTVQSSTPTMWRP